VRATATARAAALDDAWPKNTEFVIVESDVPATTTRPPAVQDLVIGGAMDQGLRRARRQLGMGNRASRNGQNRAPMVSRMNFPVAGCDPEDVEYFGPKT
jgi:hypothetical protein